MTAKTSTKTISLPIGLAERAKNAGLNISGVCADALTRAVVALNERKEYEAWCASNPGRTGVTTLSIEGQARKKQKYIDWCSEYEMRTGIKLNVETGCNHDQLEALDKIINEGE